MPSLRGRLEALGMTILGTVAVCVGLIALVVAVFFAVVFWVVGCITVISWLVPFTDFQRTNGAALALGLMVAILSPLVVYLILKEMRN